MIKKELQEAYDLLAQYPEVCQMLKNDGHTVESVMDVLNGISQTYVADDEVYGDDNLHREYADAVISDMHMKRIKYLANQSEPFSSDDVEFIMSQAGKIDDMPDDSSWSDSMIDKYADYLRNYLYTYKEEAKAVDPEIDPNERHIGPMAQDIEKVAPDCVKETHDGIKVVDGNRLALVNAGVIGDLSRRLLHLEEVQNGER